MLTDEIKTILDGLSEDDLKAVRRYCDERVMSERARFLKSALEDVAGMKFDGRDRSAFQTSLRAMLAYQMMLERFTDRQTAAAVNRGRCEVLYLRKKWKEAMKFPKMYGDVMPYWNKFQNKINDGNED